jgi:hypothetical protein
MIPMLILYSVLIVIYLIAAYKDIKINGKVQPETLTLGVLSIVIGFGLICLTLMIK